MNSGGSPTNSELCSQYHLYEENFKQSFCIQAEPHLKYCQYESPRLYHFQICFQVFAQQQNSPNLKQE